MYNTRIHYPHFPSFPLPHLRFRRHKQSSCSPYSGGDDDDDVEERSPPPPPLLHSSKDGVATVAMVSSSFFPLSQSSRRKHTGGAHTAGKPPVPEILVPSISLPSPSLVPTERSRTQGALPGRCGVWCGVARGVVCGVPSHGLIPAWWHTRHGAGSTQCPYHHLNHFIAS